MKCRRILLCIGMAASMALLAGCGSNMHQEGGQVIMEEETAEEENKVLTFFAPTDSASSEALRYKELIDRYNEGNPGIKVVFEGIATADGFNEYLEQRLDAGKGDDIFIENADSVKHLYSKGYFYDLSDLPAFGKLNSSTRSQALIGDIAYCVPVEMTAYAMFVNVDLLEEYGLTPPTDLEEFLACCRSIKEQGGTPISLNRWFALTVPTMANGLYKIYGSEDADAIIEGLNKGEIKIGDYMLEGFELFETMVKEGFYGDGLDGASVDALKAGAVDLPDFIAERTAFFFGSLGGIRDMEQANPNLNCIVLGAPNPEGTVTLPAVAARLSVNANSRYLDESLDFVTYISSGTYRKNADLASSLLPTYDDAEFQLLTESLRPAYETYMEDGQIPIEDMQLKFNYWDTVRELCIQMFDGMTAEEAAVEYNEIQEEQIALYQD